MKHRSKSRSVMRSMTGVLALTALVAACGDDGNEPAATGASTTTAADTTAASTSAAPVSEPGGGCTDPASLPTKQAGTLTVATGEPVFEPWMVDDDPANGEGFESAVVYALAAELGYTNDQVTWVRTGFDEAIAPGAKEYDFNIQQYTILPERDEVVDFSEPYYVAEKALIAFPDSLPNGATSIADLKELRFGATTGTTDLDYIENVLGISDVAVYDTQADTIAAMIAKQIDATVIALPSAFQVTAVEVPDAKIMGVLPGNDDAPDSLGMLFEDGSPLVACVNEGLASLRGAGTLDALAKQWLQGDGTIPNISE